MTVTISQDELLEAEFNAWYNYHAPIGETDNLGYQDFTKSLADFGIPVQVAKTLFLNAFEVAKTHYIVLSNDYEQLREY